MRPRAKLCALLTRPAPITITSEHRNGVFQPLRVQPRRGGSAAQGVGIMVSGLGSTFSRSDASHARCVVETLEGRALLSAGDLDPTFSGDGKLVTDLGHHSDARAVAVQADGKILVAGAEQLSEEQSRVVLLRYRT